MKKTRTSQRQKFEDWNSRASFLLVYGTLQVLGYGLLSVVTHSWRLWNMVFGLLVALVGLGIALINRRRRGRWLAGGHNPDPGGTG